MKQWDARPGYRSLFRRFVTPKVRYIPKIRYSKGPLFRRFINPKVHYSECSLFQMFVIPKVCYSEGPLCRRFVIPKVRYSNGSLIGKWKMVQNVTGYSEGSLMRKFINPKEVRYSKLQRFTSPRMGGKCRYFEGSSIRIYSTSWVTSW